MRNKNYLETCIKIQLSISKIYLTYANDRNIYVQVDVYVLLIVYTLNENLRNNAK